MSPKNLLANYGEILRYLIIGVLTTAVSLAVYYLLVFTILNPGNAFELQLANIIAWIISVLFAYFTNRRFVFRVATSAKRTDFPKFVASRLFTLFLDMAIMALGVTLLSFNDKIVKLFDQIVIIILNYLLSKFLVFTAKNSSHDIKSPEKP